MMKDMYFIEFYDDYENSNNAKNLGPMDEFSARRSPALAPLRFHLGCPASCRLPTG